MPDAWLQTARLRLIALTIEQLQRYIAAPRQLEEELGFPISRANVTDAVRRAIRIKLSRMMQADASEHPWYTYWLIVVADEPFGAGLIGFKGPPDDQGVTEIGYGIDPAYRNRGYVTEALNALIDWAFQDARCRSIVALNVARANAASNRVLEKIGMRVCDETVDTVSWRIDRAR